MSHPAEKAPLRAALFAAVALIVALAAGVAYGSLHRSLLQHEASASVTTQNMSESLLQQIGEIYASADQALLVVADEYQQQRASGRIDHQQLDGLIERQLGRHPNLTALRIASPGGDFVYGRNDVKDAVSSNIADRDYFQHLRSANDGALHVSTLIKSRITGKWVIILARRLNHPDGGFAGVVLATFGVEGFRKQFSSQRLMPNDFITLRDDKLAVILRQPDIESQAPVGTTRSSTEFQEALLRNPMAGTYVSGSTSIDGVSRLHSYRKHEVYPFYVNVGKSRDAFLQPWRAEFVATTLALLVFSAMLVLGASFLLRSWRRRELATQELAAGDRRFRSIVEASPVPMLIGDGAGNISLVNAAFTRIFGYRLQDVPNVAQLCALAFPDADYRQQTLTAWRARAQESQHWSLPFQPMEAVVHCRDGGQRTVLGEMAPLETASGVAHIVNLHDITERKAVLAELEQHRLHLEDLVAQRTRALAAAVAQSKSSEQRLQYALEASSDGVWDWNLQSNLSYVSPAYATMLGYERGSLGNDPQRNFGDLLHPEIGPNFLALTRQALTQTGRCETELRMLCQDGSNKWILRRGQVVERDADGAPLRAVGTHTDLSARKQMEIELLESRNAALAANHAKRSFLANMSHEIRTPLNAIMGISHMMRQDGLEPVQQQRLGKLEAAGLHLTQIINDILDLSKIEAGKLDLELRSLCLDEVLANAMVMLSDQAKAKEIGFNCSLETAHRWYLGDATRLQQALLNYGGNAIKFTDSGHVGIRVVALEDSATDSLLRFEVADTGVGVDAAHSARLFESFEQADNSTTRQYGGSGLGLAITRQIAQMMGGSAGFESQPGVGSTFWFTARLAKVQEAAALGVNTETELRQALRLEFSGTRALLADDEPVNMEIAEYLLEEIGFVVDQASNGKQALELALASHYDLVLLDVQMPVMDGLAAATQIRQLPAFKSTPIFALTGNAFAEDRLRCAQAGMDHFASKPLMLVPFYESLLKALRVRDPQA